MSPSSNPPPSHSTITLPTLATSTIPHASASKPTTDANLTNHSETKTTTDTTSTSQTQKKKKKKRKRTSTQTPSLPLPRNNWSYIHLTYTPSPSSFSATSTTSSSTLHTTPEIDALTLRTHLTTALTSLFGLHGSAISIDILKLSSSTSTSSTEAWIRVPREDSRAVVAAIGSWVGGEETGKKGTGGRGSWRVKGWDEWLGRVVMGGVEGGQDLFGG